jgi:hypothetical protein
MHLDISSQPFEDHDTIPFHGLEQAQKDQAEMTSNNANPNGNRPMEYNSQHPLRTYHHPLHHV